MANIIQLQNVDSTNCYLRALQEKEEQEEGTVVAAYEQTAGRGQRGNTWEAEPGKNLTFSMIFHPQEIQAADQFIISQLVSTAIKEVLDKYIPEVSIKWPNDIYCQDKKIGGILIENDLSGYEVFQSIIGIGINVNQELFLSNAPNPVSMTQVTKQQYDLDKLLKEFASQIYINYFDVLDGAEHEIKEIYKNSLYRGKGMHAYEDDNGAFLGEFVKTEPTGHLVLRDSEGIIRRYAFKEVRFV